MWSEWIRMSWASVATEERPREARAEKICFDYVSVQPSRTWGRWIPYCCEFAVRVFHEEGAELDESLCRMSVTFHRSEGAACST